MLIFSKFKSYIIGALVTMIPLLYILGIVKGKTDSKNSYKLEKSDNIIKSREIQNEIEKLPDSDIDDRLSKWMRD